MEKFTNLMKKNEQLKSLIESPKMGIIYLSDWFSELRSRIDLEFVKKDILITDISLKSKFKENWTKIISNVDLLENECIKSYKKCKNYETSQETKENLQLIENKLKNLANLFNQNITNEKYEQEIDEINDLIYDERLKIEKILFLNKTIIFFNKTNCKHNNLLGKLESEIAVGKLLVISNEYFGEKGIEFLKRYLFV